jgi:hypothetical protein
LYKHYVRLDEDDVVIFGFSSAFEEPQENDIVIDENAPRQFLLDIITNDGQFKYLLDGNSLVERELSPIINISEDGLISNATVNIVAGSGLTGSGLFTLNQISNPVYPEEDLFPSESLFPETEDEITLTISHEDTSNIGNTGESQGVFISSVTFDTFGHALSLTTSSPNNGILSLNVSGIGLAGSATFSADQFESTAFTVMSNATSSAVSDTLVSRDSSANTQVSRIFTGTGSLTNTAIAPSGDPNTGIFFPLADTLALVEGGTEVIRINSSSNVGIGTTTPATKLDVSGNIRGSAFISTVSSGTPPLTVSSTTSVVNLNADLLDGEHGTFYNNIRASGSASTNASSWSSTTAGGFSVKKNVAIVGVTINDYPEISFNLATYTIAQNASITYVETYAGGITLYATATPSGTVTFNYVIIKG